MVNCKLLGRKRSRLILSQCPGVHLWLPDVEDSYTEDTEKQSPTGGKGLYSSFGI